MPSGCLRKANKMPNKFSVGDKVIIKRRNARTPKYLAENLRLDHPRIVVAIFYDGKSGHTRYYLGINKRGNVDLSSHHFRAEELKLWIKGAIGHPKIKRKYTWHTPKPKIRLDAT